ncbi:MAG: NAD(P)/FAD-dependent oxidoreductase [Peptococcaceae bacterium]|nr:NAD(P)/FAD-dependent oxidoreductase [Peptococcaceae bacterium]
MCAYDRLFEPLHLKNLALKNRLVVPPMETNLGGLGGEVTPELIAYWEARAKGGFGLLILENSSVDPVGNVCLHTPGFFDDHCMEGLKQLTAAVHRHGAKMAAQISHSGRQTFPGIVGEQPVSASAIPCPTAKALPRELRREEIYDLAERFAEAAGRVKEAGFDAVEIHGAHGYLVAQFMSSYVNKRMDEFGGSLTNRLTFPLLIIRKVREKVGADYPVMFRFSGDERIPGGRKIQESVLIARMLEQAGIDILDVSTGVSGSGQYISAPPAVPPGYLLEETALIKQAVSVPVIAVGRLSDPALAEYALETGKADLIAIGRASLADPEFPNKAREEREDDIAPCVYCLQGCYRAFPRPEGDAFVKYTTTCLVNPFCCAETEMVIQPAAQPKKVLIAGGGPAGLAAAWVAAACGHQVTLMEKTHKLGGQLVYAAIPPYKQELTRAVIYYQRMCDRYGVNIRTGVEVRQDTVRSEQPDVVIIATGGIPLIPPVEGVDGSNVTTALAILAGETIAGRNVLIVGGGMVGCETADYLAEHGSRVTVVEMLEDIARDEPMQVRPFLMQRLQAYGVRVLSETKVVRFLPDGALIQQQERESELSGFDTIVLATGARSLNTLQAEIAGWVKEVYVIGDALQARQALQAIEEGAKTALRV